MAVQTIPEVNTDAGLYTDEAFQRYQSARRRRWDRLARESDQRRGLGGYYHQRLRQVYRSLIIPGQRVLEIGCGQGDLLAAVDPSVGVGVDFSGEMVKRADARYPELIFVQADAHRICLETTFDVIILSGLVNDVWDVQAVIEEVARLSHAGTRIILNFSKRLWEAPLKIAERLGLARPTLSRNWLTVEDVDGLLGLAGCEIVRHEAEILWPIWTPLLASLTNRYISRIWPASRFTLEDVIVARPLHMRWTEASEPSVSVIIPARNEAGNIEQIFDRVPDMGSGTELVFVEGHSIDDTQARIRAAILDRPERRCKLLTQTNTGKGDAVRLGFKHASGEICMILDADMTVPPEDLPRFYRALLSGKGEFVNGVRLVYPMARQAMRFFNLIGNKFFSVVFSWLLGRPIRDTLCGTKALWRTDYERLAYFRSVFGDFDPFGDFDLLFGAAKMNLQIVELPIRYRERTYGKTNIHRWRHGWMLLRMVIFAAKWIKFV